MNAGEISRPLTDAFAAWMRRSARKPGVGCSAWVSDLVPVLEQVAAHVLQLTRRRDNFGWQALARSAGAAVTHRRAIS